MQIYINGFSILVLSTWIANIQMSDNAASAVEAAS